MELRSAGVLMGLLLCSCTGEQSASREAIRVGSAASLQEPALYPFRALESRGANQWEPGYFALPIEAAEYRLEPGSANEVGAERITVQVEEGWFIERAYAAPFDGDILIVVETTGGGYGSGAMLRVDPQGGRVIWTAMIGTFNLAHPAVRGGSAYVSGLGVIEKIDLATGDIRWRHPDLWEKGKYNSFEPAQFAGDTVVFIESAPTRRVVRALDNTGQIIGPV